MTLTEMKNYFYLLIAQTSSTTELDTGNDVLYLDEAYRKLCREHGAIVSTKTLTFSGTDDETGVPEYYKSLSDLAISNYELLGIHSVEYTNPSTKQTYTLSELPTGSLLEEFTNTATGQPTSTDGKYYSFRRTTNEAFHIYPAVSSDTTVKVNFYVVPTITIPSGGPSDVPAFYHGLIVKQAVFDFLLSRADEAAMAFFQTMVQPDRNQFEQWCRSQNPEPVQSFGSYR